MGNRGTDQDELHHVLVPLEPIEKGKIDATHTMSPVGPSILHHPQHGMLREVDYQTRESINGYARLEAYDPTQQLFHTREVILDEGIGYPSLNLVDTLSVPRLARVDTSMGPHFYFEVDEESIGDIALLTEGRRQITDTFGVPFTGSPEIWVEQLKGGTPFLLHPTSPHIDVAIPRKHTLRIGATVTQKGFLNSMMEEKNYPRTVLTSYFIIPYFIPHQKAF